MSMCLEPPDPNRIDRRDSKFCLTLRSIRQAAGMTMGAMARHLNISVSEWSQVEGGNRRPWRVDEIDYEDLATLWIKYVMDWQADTLTIERATLQLTVLAVEERTTLNEIRITRLEEKQDGKGEDQ